MMGGVVNRGAYVSDSLLLLLLLLLVKMTTAGDDGCADNGERISWRSSDASRRRINFVTDMLAV